MLNYKYENTTTFVHENIMSINFVSTYLTSIPLVGDQMYQWDMEAVIFMYSTHVPVVCL